MTKNMIKSIREVTSFTGYHLTELKVLQLDDLLFIDNFRKAMVNSKDGDKEGQESTKKFIRKGGIISEGIFNLVPSTKKQLKSLSLNFLSSPSASRVPVDKRSF